MESELPEFPAGWYAVALSRDLRRGDVRRKRFGRQACVLYRTDEGRPVLAGAYCPHLGAHLGYGGKVHGETLQCPFHGFRFDVDGACSYVPYGTAPPAARLETLPLVERNGLLLAFQGDPAAAWEIPAVDQAEYGPLRARRWVLRGHPQEVTENSVDLGHFTVVHGYEGVEVIQPAEVEGAVLRSKYAMTRANAVLGRPVRFVIDVAVRGLGYSTVDVDIVDVGAKARLFVLPRALGSRRIELRIAMQLHRHVEPAALSPALRRMPRALYRRIISEAVFRGFAADVQQDFRIWNHKRFVRPPALAEGDGPIGLYRRWARQFYPDG
jgi:nitrite reductase/ring-hydroxylating ferredoxin subunit